MTIKETVRLVREGRYAAEVPVELHYSDEAWSPTISLEDARRLDAVRVALKRGDTAEAARYGRVYELLPLAG
jgi:hypothetical protein